MGFAIRHSHSQHHLVLANITNSFYLNSVIVSHSDDPEMADNNPYQNVQDNVREAFDDLLADESVYLHKKKPPNYSTFQTSTSSLSVVLERLVPSLSLQRYAFSSSTSQKMMAGVKLSYK